MDLVDLGFETERVEDGHVALVVRELCARAGCGDFDEACDAFECWFGIDDDAVDLGAEQVAYGADEQV